MKPMILHNFNKSMFLRTYIQFLSKHYDIHNHYILTDTTDQHDASAAYDKILANFPTSVKPSISIKHLISYFIHSRPIRKKMKRADLIIAHGFTDMWYYFFSPSTLKKTVWVIWGFDLYDYRTRKNSLYSRIHFQIKKQLVKRIPYVVARVPDYHLLQEWYGSKAELLLVEPLYTNGEFESVPLTIRDNPSSPIKITLGNSATKTNHHIETLEILRKFRDENIHLYIPLSYGDMEYAEIVKEKAKEIFGNKVTILDKFMDPDEYNKHLSTMDIGIFNLDRQQALGNISYLLASGTKIYLDSTSPLWEIFEGYKFRTHPISNLTMEDFDKFMDLDIDELTYNAQHAKEIYSEKHSVECWTRVFNLANEKRP